MELNSRCVKILRETSKEKDGLSAAALINELGITRRILYYDLNKINDWLKASKLGKVEVSGGRLSLQTDYLRKIDGVLGSFSAYVFSVEERRAIEILTIALSAAPVTSGHLQSLLDVSQNTILNDVKEWKAMLDPLLGITTGGKRGYSLSGEEAAARRLIGSQFEVLQNEYPRILRDNLLQNSLAELTRANGQPRRRLSFAR